MSEFETEDELLARHRKENKELIANITGLKKQATKSKKKEVQRKCADMELKLKEKHEQELKVSLEKSIEWYINTNIPVFRNLDLVVVMVTWKNQNKLNKMKKKKMMN